MNLAATWRTPISMGLPTCAGGSSRRYQATDAHVSWSIIGSRCQSEAADASLGFRAWEEAAPRTLPQWFAGQSLGDRNRNHAPVVGARGQAFCGFAIRVDGPVAERLQPRAQSIGPICPGPTPLRWARCCIGTPLR